MGLERPAVSNVTAKAREIYPQHSTQVLDIGFGTQYNVNLLQYVLVLLCLTGDSIIAQRASSHLMTTSDKHVIIFPDVKSMFYQRFPFHISGSFAILIRWDHIPSWTMLGETCHPSVANPPLSRNAVTQQDLIISLIPQTMGLTKRYPFQHLP